MFLDLNMPIMNGFECLEAIRSTPHLKDLLVAIYSTSSAERDIEETFEKGANIYIKKPSSFNELKKSASGGELSRIMLAIKSILAEYIQLPSIMFDEIDTGVSGEISNKMGEIMKQMSGKMQVFTITHLPQIAAKGNSHFKVFKTDIDNKTHTQLKQLNDEERVVEIAQMLGGLTITESAKAHAKQLLN